MLIETLSTFPHMYDSVMGESMMKRAQEKGILEFRAHDLRDWTHDRHRTTDDDPYGGGAGLVMKCEPIFEAVEAILGERVRGSETCLSHGGAWRDFGWCSPSEFRSERDQPTWAVAPSEDCTERLSTTRKPAPEESQG